MLDAIERIREFVGGASFEEFTADHKTVSAVLYQFVVLGEAARSMPPDVCQAHPQVAWGDVRAFRNVMTHVYFGVKLDLVWDTIRADLPVLERQLREVLEAQA